MPVTSLPIANGFYVSDSLPISAQECVNWYPNIVQAPALSQETLFGTPGKFQVATSGDLKQINRGALAMNERPYFINGDMLYRLNQAFIDGDEQLSLEALGTIDGEGRVSLATNGTQLMILVPGGQGYIFEDAGDTLTEITDAGFRANGDPQYVTFADGLFICNTDEDKWIVSAVNDGLSWNALDVATANKDPDGLVVPWTFRDQVFLGGTETTQAYQNIGGADFPFQYSGLALTKGVKAPFSVVLANDTFMFIGAGKNESPAIWAFQGNSMVKVSTTAIDSILQDFTDLEIQQSFAYAYAQKGAYFVAFALPTTKLVLNTITNRWHEEKSQVIDALNNTIIVRDRANSLVQAYGRILVGDALDGRIGVLDPDTYTEYDRNIIRRVATQPFQNNMMAFRVPTIELTMEAGVGNAAVPNPQVVMDRSLDGGKTWKDERARAMGKIGEYGRRTIWRRNGRAARYEVFRFTLSDAVKPVIIQLTADIRG